MWKLSEAVVYYKKQGAPGDQTALVSLLREVQDRYGGIPLWSLPVIAEELGTKESFLQAIVCRIPSLRLADTHVLELCAGPNCGKAAALAKEAEKLCAQTGVTLRYCGCMRLCGKGPNLKLDGELYHKADRALLEKLLKKQQL